MTGTKVMIRTDHLGHAVLYSQIDGERIQRLCLCSQDTRIEFLCAEIKHLTASDTITRRVG